MNRSLTTCVLALAAATACDPEAPGCTDRSQCDAGEHCLLGPQPGVGRCIDAPGRDEPGPGVRVVRRPMPASLLLVIDDAPDGLEPQRRLLAALPAMLERVQWTGVRLRLGVTTTSVASPICEPRSLAHSGALARTSCLDRLDDFVAADGTDARSLCTDVCSLTTEALGLSEQTPWIDLDRLGPDIDPVEALSCLVAQGVSGCEHGAPLAVAAASEARDGFTRWPIGHDAVLMVTPGVDCSITATGAAAFDPAGDRSLWTDPLADAPTPAVCWRAGVSCSGSPPSFDDCEPAEIGLHGEPTRADESPVLMPLSELQPFHPSLGLGWLGAIVGVPLDGDPLYTTQGDAAFVEQHGIAAGCRDETLAAVPPVRLRSVSHARSSICSPSYDDALASAVPSIYGPCFRSEEVPALTVRYEDPEHGEREIPICGGEDPWRTIPEGAPACYAWRDNPWLCPFDTPTQELVVRAHGPDGFGLFRVEPSGFGD